ncbi:unnamed protein product [Staurois parvus]|uniref:Uncharacterized protein n=1 Tax=Staurois parvus TaxID=386267 RepID=A0ABN9E467_9NEOB|nr:unnamed protein product [Staurois parvus]
MIPYCLGPHELSVRPSQSPTVWLQQRGRGWEVEVVWWRQAYSMSSSSECFFGCTLSVGKDRGAP